MKNKLIILLLLISIIPAGILSYLDSEDILTPHQFTLGSTPKEPVGFIIDWVVKLSGLFLTIFMIPLLFKNGLNNWKIKNSSWKWQISLVVFIALIGNLMAGAFGYGIYAIIPLNIIIFIGAMIWSLVGAWKAKEEASFWSFVSGIFVSFVICAGLLGLFVLFTLI